MVELKKLIDMLRYISRYVSWAQGRNIAIDESLDGAVDERIERIKRIMQVRSKEELEGLYLELAEEEAVRAEHLREMRRGR